MNDMLELTCPSCKNTWKKSLREMEVVQDIYRDAHPHQKDKGVEYRTACPFCGTYVIVEVKED